jgi:hypothetical protein
VTDHAGNETEVKKSYAVGYAVCELYDWTKSQRAGANYTIKIELCDAAGTNVSSEGIVLTAIEVVDKDGTTFRLEPNFSGGSNDGFVFRYNATDNSYIYNLKTDDFPAGASRLGYVTSPAPLTEQQRNDIVTSGGSTNWARFTLSS